MGLYLVCPTESLYLDCEGFVLSKFNDFLTFYNYTLNGSVTPYNINSKVL